MLFKMKAKKNGVMKNIALMGTGELMEKVGKSMKVAGYQMENMRKYVEKNPGLKVVGDRIQHHPAGSIMTIAGIGLAVFGLASLFRK